MSYLRHASPRGQTPQSRPIPGTPQVENSAGGFVWKVDPTVRFLRWLILGSEGGSYYASQQELTFDNVAVLDEIDPMGALELVLNVSLAGRAPRQDQVLYALAHFARHPKVQVRQRALEIMPDICRTGTHLFQFISYIDAQGRPNAHWGRALRRAVAKWYARPVTVVGYQVVKYRQRFGYTHRDLLRLAHPSEVVSSHNPAVELTRDHAYLFDWITHGNYQKDNLPKIVRGYHRAQLPKNKAKLPALIQQYALPWECIPDEDINRPEVLDALLRWMPPQAMIRQLPRMTRAGLLRPLSEATEWVVDTLRSKTILSKARVHPMQLLVAQMTYAAGKSLRGDSTWTPVPQITAALDVAFYNAFGSVEPTGKRHLLAVDVSGSMTSAQVMGIPGFTPRMAAAAMALVQANVGDPYHMVAFSADKAAYRKFENQRANYGYLRDTEMLWNAPEAWAIEPLDITPGQRLDDVQRVMHETQAGGTDLALPMKYATDHQLSVDVFCIYTDNEGWAGGIHPSQALQQYRQQSGINARLVVCALTATNYSVADPNDAGQMDVVGFDTATPEIISMFAKGEV